MADDSDAAETSRDATGLRGIARRASRINFDVRPENDPLQGAALDARRLAEFTERFARVPDLDLGSTPEVRAAAAGEKSVEVLEEMKGLVAEMIGLTARTLAVSESARLDAARSEKAARTTSWASVVIAGASLAAAVIAIIVSL